MKRLITMPLAIIITVGPTAASAQHDHDAELRSGKIPRRTAIVSDEVAIQRVIVSGIDVVGDVRDSKDGNLHVPGRFQGREIIVEIDRKSGVIREAGRSSAIAARSLVRPAREENYAFREQIARGTMPVVVLPQPRASTTSRVSLTPIGDEPNPVPR